MSKNARMWVIIGAIAVTLYLGYKIYQNYTMNSPGGGPLGTNLNSIAPELVGGSQGPVAQPAFNVPVNINVSSTAPPPETPDSGDQMIPANATSSYGGSSNALTQQSDAAGVASGTMPQGDNSAAANPDYTPLINQGGQ